MRRAGRILIVLGLVFLTAAASLAARNHTEDTQAGAASARALTAIEKHMDAPSETEAARDDDLVWLGRLTIPTLELDLPVFSEWSYENLKTAPCRYCGSAEGGNLVLLAHNYRTHFGPIRRLKPGDRVVFEDMTGTVFAYRVAATDIVAATAHDEVISGSHALTLITCTYGGKNRIVVYCDAVAELSDGKTRAFLTPHTAMYMTPYIAISSHALRGSYRNGCCTHPPMRVSYFLRMYRGGRFLPITVSSALLIHFTV